MEAGHPVCLVPATARTLHPVHLRTHTGTPNGARTPPSPGRPELSGFLPRTPDGNPHCLGPGCVCVWGGGPSTGPASGRLPRTLGRAAGGHLVQHRLPLLPDTGPALQAAAEEDQTASQARTRLPVGLWGQGGLPENAGGVCKATWASALGHLRQPASSFSPRWSSWSCIPVSKGLSPL